MADERLNHYARRIDELAGLVYGDEPLDKADRMALLKLVILEEIVHNLESIYMNGLGGAAKRTTSPLPPRVPIR